MDVVTAIQTRRAYRSLDPVTITADMVKELTNAAGLAASCFNKQPWRFVFVYDPETLIKMREALSKGNEWAYDASMIIAVVAKKDDDCVIKDGREYYLFDTGMAAAHLILRATELGLVAHPIAGFDPEKVREILADPGGDDRDHPDQCGKACGEDWAQAEPRSSQGREGAASPEAPGGICLS